MKALTFGLFMSVFAFAQAARIDSELKQLRPGNTIHVLVQFHNGVEPSSYSRFSNRIHHSHNLEIIRTGVYEVTNQAELQMLESDPDVEFVGLDRPVATKKYEGPPDYAWMQTLGVTAPFGTAAFDGTGVGVAVIDSGINASPDLMDAKGNSRITYNANFSSDANFADGYGHGTFVAGLIASNGASLSASSDKYWIRGIAPNATLINLKALNSQGSGTDSSVIAAIQAATQLPSALHVKIINLSLGRPVTASCAVDLLCQAVTNAWAKGFVVVVAAGNDGRTVATQGYGTINVPGNNPFAITVGASNTQGVETWSSAKMASYSSKGPTAIDHVVKPDLVASGNQLLGLRVNGSTLDKTLSTNGVPEQVYAASNSNSVKSYFQLSGTSMAAGVASGAVALVLQEHPNYTPDQIKLLLMATAYKFTQKASVATDPTTGVQYTSNYDIFTVGAGDLNVAAALQARAIPPVVSMASPVATPTSGSVQLTSAQMSVWGSNAIWGSNALWGSNVIWGSNALWGSNAIWGSSALFGASSSTTDATNISANGDQ